MKRVVIMLLLAASLSGVAAVGEKSPLQVAVIWHQHQPLYWNRLTGEYELPWVRIHAVQEYIDSARISAEFPSVHVAFNLQPSLLWQLEDYATITAEEAAKGGLYELVGAVDNHLKWLWTLVHDAAGLPADDRANLQEQAFWINGYMFDDDANDPYFDLRYAELNALRGTRDLDDQELLDASGLFLLWQISPELHESFGVASLRGHRDWTWPDIQIVLEAQMRVLQSVVDAYRAAAALGNELFTSPFYHPILPLLAARGWEGDVIGQLAAAQAQHERLFGAPAEGVWPPEQAVSDAAVSLLSDAGFAWTTTDEGLLAQALGRSPSAADLTQVYCYEGTALLFRESELSNRISFAYGNKPTEAAVADFMGELRRIYDEVEDPTGRLLTIALDGENWMFMAGYPNNGRSFLRQLYAALADADWVRAVTPSEALASVSTLLALPSLPVGSWAGDLATWSGEPDEDEAWEHLAAARAAVSAAGDPAEALSAIYAAQGSDWFWWYGTDQDSNTDDLFDWLFKSHLIGAYRAAGVQPEEVPAVLTLRLVPPMPASLGEVSPTVNGISEASEGWSDAVTVTSQGPLAALRLAYRETNLCVQVETLDSASAFVGQDLILALYASGRPGEPANVATRYGSASLGFPLASAIQLSFSKLDANGVGIVSKYAADGRGGWTYASTLPTIAQRKAAVGSVIEFSVPFAELGVEPGKAVTLTVVLERAGETMGKIPQTPLLASIPTLIRGVERASVDDPRGDDYGPGSYVYPLNSVFDVEGLFDLVRYSVYDAGTSWQFAYDFAALPNPWNGPQGFSHPLLYLYFDVADGGLTDSHPEGEAARVAFDPNHPWDVFVRVAGWPAYGRHLWTAAGEGPFLVEVASDPKRGRVIVTIPKLYLPAAEGWHYVLVGSQDGYGQNYLRSIGASPGEWAGGGNPDPFWAPGIYDLVVPEGIPQAAMLSAYDAAAGQYVTLVPLHISLDSE
ncbi:MAG: glucodextranase DOMON-like domain-containing protein [Candidatus Bipolaricaulota bacterium]